MSSVIAALQGMGIEVRIHGQLGLVMSQGQTQFNTSLALRNFSKRPENAAFFVLENDHPSTWTEHKIKFIAQNGDEKYRTLWQSPVLEAGVRTMDPNMTKTDYENLTRAERIAFIREYGSDAVGRIHQKSK